MYAETDLFLLRPSPLISVPSFRLGPKKRTRIISHGLKAERSLPPNECWDLGSRRSKEGSCLIGTIVFVVLWQSI